MSDHDPTRSAAPVPPTVSHVPDAVENHKYLVRVTRELVRLKAELGEQDEADKLTAKADALEGNEPKK